MNPYNFSTTAIAEAKKIIKRLDNKIIPLECKEDKSKLEEKALERMRKKRAMLALRFDHGLSTFNKAKEELYRKRDEVMKIDNEIAQLVQRMNDIGAQVALGSVLSYYISSEYKEILTKISILKKRYTYRLSSMITFEAALYSFGRKVKAGANLSESERDTFEIEPSARAVDMENTKLPSYISKEQFKTIRGAAINRLAEEQPLKQVYQDSTVSLLASSPSTLEPSIPSISDEEYLEQMRQIEEAKEDMCLNKLK